MNDAAPPTKAEAEVREVAPPRSPDQLRDDVDFIRKVLIAIALVSLIWLAWKLAKVLLLAFAAVLVAVILSAIAGLIARRTPVPRRWSLTVATVGLFILVAGALLLFGAQMQGQMSNLVERLPLALDTFGKEFGIENLSGELPKMVGDGTGASLVGTVASYGQTLLGGLADLVLVVAAGIYMASEPRLYRRGFVKLFPRAQHERVEDAVQVAGYSLKAWLGAQIISMTGVGILSGLAFWIIGLPNPIALGVISGVLDFVPFVGPILGALPAVLLSFTVGGDAVLWTIVAVIVIQQIEGNVILPIVTRRAVDLPPAIALFAVIAFGLLFGAVGLFLAMPLAVVTLVLVKKLYVRQTLGEETEVAGEDEAKKEAASKA